MVEGFQHGCLKRHLSSQLVESVELESLVESTKAQLSCLSKLRLPVLRESLARSIGVPQHARRRERSGRCGRPLGQPLLDFTRDLPKDSYVGREGCPLNMPDPLARQDPKGGATPCSHRS